MFILPDESFQMGPSAKWLSSNRMRTSWMVTRMTWGGSSLWKCVSTEPRVRSRSQMQSSSLLRETPTPARLSRVRSEERGDTLFLLPVSSTPTPSFPVRHFWFLPKKFNFKFLQYISNSIWKFWWNLKLNFFERNNLFRKNYIMIFFKCSLFVIHFPTLYPLKILNYHLISIIDLSAYAQAGVLKY